MAKISPLEPGDPAPPFIYRGPDGTEHSSEQLEGGPYLLFFYPRDNSPGCTREACGFRDAYAEFTAQNITIIGASTDSEDSHRKFREKNSLPFTLAADSDKTMVKAFGVWGEKKNFGKIYEGIYRSTFLVGADQKIIKTFSNVKPEDHAREILDYLKTLAD